MSSEKTTLDLKDKKILYELDKNSRESLKIIGKKVGLSKNSVKYRITQLEKSGVIKSYHAVIDLGKLGYLNFRLYLNLQNTTLEKEKEIIDFLKKQGIVNYIAYSDSEYNLIVEIITKNIIEMYNLWDQLLNKYVNYISERLLTINITSTSFYRDYLIEKPKEVYEIKTSKTRAEFKLDNLDLDIIKILSKDAKTQIINMATKLKVTEKTIITHLRTLESQKIIVAYRTCFDLEKLGYKGYKLRFLLQKITEKESNELINYVKKHPNVISRDESLGGSDFEIDIEVKDDTELSGLLDDIRKKFGEFIQDYQILSINKEHKNVFFVSK